MRRREFFARLGGATWRASCAPLTFVIVIFLVALMCLASHVSAAQCGSTAAGFEAWKQQFANEARGRGISTSTAAVLMTTTYSSATIAADRGQRSFSLSL